MLRDRVDALPWWHEMDLGDGVVTPGAVKQDVLARQADVYFKDGVAGFSVLDIGCWDGFNSFEAARRGARSVLATDHVVWADPRGIGSREAFELARQQLAPEVDVLDIDLPDMSPERVGCFDLVLFCGVLYHLRDPLGGLEIAASVTAGTLVVETAIDALNVERPAMVFYPGTELNNDPTNWWGPNPACVVAMLKVIGLERIEHSPHPLYENRAIFHARRA